MVPQCLGSEQSWVQSVTRCYKCINNTSKKLFISEPDGLMSSLVGFIHTARWVPDGSGGLQISSEVPAAKRNSDSLEKMD